MTPTPSSAAPQDLPEPDAADIIAGALQCSRGYAYTVMERALADRYPAAARQESVPARKLPTHRDVQRAIDDLMDFRPSDRPTSMIRGGVWLHKESVREALEAIFEPATTQEPKEND